MIKRASKKNKFKDKIIIIYIFFLITSVFLLCDKPNIFIYIYNLGIGGYYLGSVICEDYLIYASFFYNVVLFAVGNLCIIRCCSLLDDLLKKHFSHIVLGVLFLMLLIFARNSLNHAILLLMGSGLLMRSLYIEMKVSQKNVMIMIFALLITCIMIVVTGFSPKQYIGKLDYFIADQNNINEIFLSYKEGESYKRVGTSTESNNFVFKIETGFLNSEESVFSVTQKSDLQENTKIELVGFKLYRDDFLISSIPGSTLMSWCNSVINLDYEIVNTGSTMLNWSEGTYAQIYFKNSLTKWMKHSMQMDFTWALHAISFLMVLVISQTGLRWLFYKYKLKLDVKRNYIILYCSLLLYVSVTEVLSIDSLDCIMPIAFIVNVFLSFFINLIIFSLLNIQITVFITGMFFTIVGIANYYTLMYRGYPILPWDVYAINTALSVSGNYDIYITWEMFWKLFIITIPIWAYIDVHKNINNDISRRHWKERGITILIGIVSIFLIMKSEFLQKIGIQENVYNQKTNYAENGWILSSMLNMRYIFVEKPQHFSERRVQEILNQYETQNETNIIEDIPNIVIILNESFADLQSLYLIETNEEVTPFINSLTGCDVEKGTCYVSQMGGGTCNSEYELLMGSTMAFFPRGSIVFQQHMNGEQYSLINILNDVGYNTIAMHPMPGSNWNRTKAYPMLQFKNMVFYNDLLGKEFIREYTSDKYCYKWIIDQFKNKTEDEKLAIYTLTVQNHGGFNYENYDGNITINNQDNHLWNQYLSLVHESDAALEELLNFFKSIDDKVIVLFLGDHQPALPDLSDSSEENNTFSIDKYSVPYLFWNNYNEPMEVPETISINYLATYLLKNCKIQRSLYYLFLEDMSKEIPIIIGDGYQEDDIFYQWGSTDKSTWIEEYKILQYGLNSAEVQHKKKYYE